MLISLRLSYLIPVIVVCVLSGCTSDLARAPVVNGWHQKSAASEKYKVRAGDSLYSVAWAFGLDYRDLALANNLSEPYNIRSGQLLVMTTKPPSSDGSVSSVESKYDVSAQQTSTIKSIDNTAYTALHWVWPTKGQLVSRFSAGDEGFKGISIAGTLGQPVLAAADGEVVYSGSGVRGYGDLILIKNNDSYLSAYAFNQKRLVVVGQKVSAGQEIAQMGHNNAGKTLLYFEIRKGGLPINPLILLG